MNSPYGPMASWDVGSITDFSDLFGPLLESDDFYNIQRDDVFNADITAWNTSAATTFEKMFHYAADFNQELNEWDTGAVITFASMFEGAEVFNQPLNDWDTGASTSFGGMFWRAGAFNQPLNEWNTGAATTFTNMFRDASAMLANGCDKHGPPSCPE